MTESNNDNILINEMISSFFPNCFFPFEEIKNNKIDILLE